MQLNRLTAVRVQQVRKPGFYPDGGGLYLQVTQGAAKDVVNKSWLFRFSVSDASKPRKRHDRWAGLGPIGTVSLVEARAAALEARQLRRSGIDPIEHRKAARAAQALADAKAMTFDQCRDAFIAANSSGWKNEKHRDQWTNTLSTYVTPVFGTLPVAAVDTALVMRVLEPIWATKPETASRVRQRIERVLSWAKVRGFREGDNPATWRGHLDHLLPARSKVRKVRHHPALPYDRIGAFMTALRKLDSISARALEFTILTAVRTGDITGDQANEKPGARWDQVDFQDRVWTIPSTKTEKELRVPLSDDALAVLMRMQEIAQSDYIFPGDPKDKPLSNGAMSELLKGMGDWRDKHGDKVTVHGFRSSFRDWGGDKTHYEHDLLEFALGHKVGDETEKAYRRGDGLEKRRRLMEDWANYCAMAPATGKTVVPMLKASRAGSSSR
jgi:integrase